MVPTVDDGDVDMATSWLIHPSAEPIRLSDHDLQTIACALCAVSPTGGPPGRVGELQMRLGAIAALDAQTVHGMVHEAVRSHEVQVRETGDVASTSSVDDDSWLVVLQRTSPSHFVMSLASLLQSVGMQHSRDPGWAGAAISVREDCVSVVAASGDTLLTATPLFEYVAGPGMFPLRGQE